MLLDGRSEGVKFNGKIFNPEKCTHGQGYSVLESETEDIDIPKVFATMAGGKTIGTIFFFLVALAALTSSISLMETIVSVLSEKLKFKRITII